MTGFVQMGHICIYLSDLSIKQLTKSNNIRTILKMNTVNMEIKNVKHFLVSVGP